MEFYISKGNTDVVIVRLLRAVINISGEIIRNKRLKRIIMTPRGAAMNAVTSKYIESRSYFLRSHHSEFAPRKKLALKIKRQIDPFVTSRLFSFPPFLQGVLSRAVSRTVNIISKWNFATIRVRHVRVHTYIKVKIVITVIFCFSIFLDILFCANYAHFRKSGHIYETSWYSNIYDHIYVSSLYTTACGFMDIQMSKMRCTGCAYFFPQIRLHITNNPEMFICGPSQLFFWMLWYACTSTCHTHLCDWSTPPCCLGTAVLNDCESEVMAYTVLACSYWVGFYDALQL